MRRAGDHSAIAPGGAPSHRQHCGKFATSYRLCGHVVTQLSSKVTQADAKVTQLGLKVTSTPSAQPFLRKDHLGAFLVEPSGDRFVDHITRIDRFAGLLLPIHIGT